MKIQVKIVQGPAADRSFVIEQNSSCVVGRGEDADFRITNDPLISRAHFAIAFDGKQVKLTDFGSTNGTFVEGVALTKDHPVYLRDGQSFIAGRTSHFVVSLVRLPQSPPEPSSDTFSPAPTRITRPTNPLTDSSEFIVSETPPPVAQPTPRGKVPAPDSSAVSGNFSQSIVSEISREPRLGGGTDSGPTDQSGLLFSNFSTTGSGEFFASGSGTDQSFSSSPPPPEKLPEPPVVKRDSDSGRSPQSPVGNPTPLPPDNQYFGSIAPPGMMAGGNREFKPLEPPPAEAPVSNLPATFASEARTPEPTDFVSDPNDDDLFSADQSTPVHPRSPQAVVSGASSEGIGMPGQIHEASQRRPDTRRVDRKESSETAVPLVEKDFEVKQLDNGLYFFNGLKSADLPTVLAALRSSYEPVYCVDFVRAGVDPKSAAKPKTESAQKIESTDSDGPVSNFMAIDDDDELEHQSPFEDVEVEGDSITSPIANSESADKTSNRVGTPLFHWLPVEARWMQPLLLTQAEFLYDVADLWHADALVCFFGSSSKQMIEHCQQLIRTNVLTGKSGDSMFGFCWPGVMGGTLETQSAKVVDRVFAGGVAAVLLEDPQQELGWRIASKVDLTEMLRTALGNPQH